ncbi:hypothetical protein [Caldifermentibacillus hisashii]
MEKFPSIMSSITGTTDITTKTFEAIQVTPVSSWTYTFFDLTVTKE